MNSRFNSGKSCRFGMKRSISSINPWLCTRSSSCPLKVEVSGYGRIAKVMLTCADRILVIYAPMRIFYYVGPNEKTKGNFSCKFWKITRVGTRVIAEWGHARVRGKRCKPVGTAQRKVWNFKTEIDARTQLHRRIAAKVREGYWRTPRRKTS